MAATTAAVVAERLLGAGRPADQPVAAIHRAGHPDQRTARVTLADLARQGCPFPAPTVLVIGAVAGERAGQASRASARAASWGGPAARSSPGSSTESDWGAPAGRRA